MHDTSAAPRQPHMKKVSSFFNELRYCLTRVELIGKHNNEQHGHKAHEHSADGEKTFSAFSRHHTQEDRQVPPTNSGDWTIMSNSSSKRIITTTRQCCLGVMTARMTPTAQADQKSWYVSASQGREGGKRDKGEETLSQWPRGRLSTCHVLTLLW